MNFSTGRALLILLATAAIPLHAADDGYTLRTETSEVRLAFSASDRHGTPVTALRPTDVAVADNGWIIRNFRSFRPAAESPLELVVLIDASDSLAAELPREVAEVQSLVANTQWGPRDRVSILVFGGAQPQLVCARNCQEPASQVKLDSLRSRGVTPLYDALVKAAELLQNLPESEARPAIILFSDGVDTYSTHSLHDALRAAEKQQAAIYCFNTRNPKHGGDGDRLLDDLAQMSGGLSYPPGQKMGEALRVVIDDLHSGYVLTYQLPSARSGEHSVRLVPTRDPRLQLRSRRSYDDGTR